MGGDACMTNNCIDALSKFGLYFFISKLQNCSKNISNFVTDYCYCSIEATDIDCFNHTTNAMSTILEAMAHLETTLVRNHLPISQTVGNDDLKALALERSKYSLLAALPSA